MDVQLDGDIRAIIGMSDGFGRHRVLVWAYAELFGITPLGAKAKKTRVILEAVKKLFDAGQFSYQKRLYSISADGIAEALNTIVQRNFQDGLDSHNYLKKIMIGVSEREAQAASRVAEKTLRKREQALQAGIREQPKEDPGSMPEEREVPDVAKAEIARLFGPDKVLNSKGRPKGSDGKTCETCVGPAPGREICNACDDH